MRRCWRAIWRWWNTPWMARWGRFVLFHLVVFGHWCFLRWHPSTIENDRRLLLYIAISAALVAITTSVGVFWITRSWTLRAAGLVGFALGDYTLYQAFSGHLYDWFKVETWMTDLARSYFAIGLTVLNAGVLLWFTRIYRSRRISTTAGRPRDLL